MAEVDATIFRVVINGHPCGLKIVSLGEEQVEVELSDPTISLRNLTVNGTPHVMERRDNKLYAPAALLWEVQRPDFDLVGYALKIDGWNDPVRFLRDRKADTNPAPFQLHRGR